MLDVDRIQEIYHGDFRRLRRDNQNQKELRFHRNSILIWLRKHLDWLETNRFSSTLTICHRCPILEEESFHWRVDMLFDLFVYSQLNLISMLKS